MSEDLIQVAIRVRPQIKREIEKKCCWQVKENEISALDDAGRITQDTCFTFDYILDSNKTNEHLYELVKPIIQSVTDGINGTIFGYGQTSSGKTHSIIGTKTDLGIIPRAVDDIFTYIENKIDRTFLIRASYMEIYNEKINDLLDLNNKDLKIREDYYGNLIVGCKEVIARTRDELMKIVDEGNNNRAIGETKMNDRSSRSHTIIKIVIESSKYNPEIDNKDEPVQVSNLYIIDLAGSERISQTNATNTRMKEGVSINKSLSVLTLVIKQLSEGSQHKSFRDSKLTRLLSNALGGNSKTLILAAITPFSYEDSLSTLLFARQAKTIKNTPRVNEVLSDAALIQQHKTKERMLRSELEGVLKINNDLQLEQEVKDKKIKDLEDQIKSINYDFVCRRPEIKKPKGNRRHTLAGSKVSFSVLTPLIEQPEHDLRLSENFKIDYETIPELMYINPDSRPVTPEINVSAASSPNSTPRHLLRIRYQELDNTHAEIKAFQKQEILSYKQALEEYEMKLIEMKKKNEEAEINIAQLELETNLYKKRHAGRETELLSMIFELKSQQNNSDRALQLQQEIEALRMTQAGVDSLNTYTKTLEEKMEKIQTENDSLKNKINDLLIGDEAILKRSQSDTSLHAESQNSGDELLTEMTKDIASLHNLLTHEDSRENYEKLVLEYESKNKKLTEIIFLQEEELKRYKDVDQIASLNEEINNLKVRNNQMLEMETLITNLENSKTLEMNLMREEFDAALLQKTIELNNLSKRLTAEISSNNDSISSLEFEKKSIEEKMTSIDLLNKEMSLNLEIEKQKISHLNKEISLLNNKFKHNKEYFETEKKQLLENLELEKQKFFDSNKEITLLNNKFEAIQEDFEIEKKQLLALFESEKQKNENLSRNISSIEQRNKEIDIEKQQIFDLNKEISLLNDNLIFEKNQLLNSLESERQNIFYLNKEITLCNIKFEDAEDDKKRLLKNLESDKEKVSDLTQEISLLKNNLEVSQEKFEIEKKQLIALFESEKQKNEDLSKEISLIEQRDKEIKMEEQKIFDLNKEISLLNNKFKVIEIEKKQLLESLESHRQKIFDSNKEIADCANEKKQLLESLELDKQKIFDLNKEIMLLINKLEITEKDFQIEKKQLLTLFESEKLKNQNLSKEISLIWQRNEEISTEKQKIFDLNKEISILNNKFEVIEIEKKQLLESLESHRHKIFDSNKEIADCANEKKQLLESLELDKQKIFDLNKQITLLINKLEITQEDFEIEKKQLLTLFESEKQKNHDLSKEISLIEQRDKEIKMEEQKIFDLNKEISILNNKFEVIEIEKKQLLESLESHRQKMFDSNKEIADCANEKKQLLESLELDKQKIFDLNKEITLLINKLEITQEDFEIEKKQLLTLFESEKQKNQDLSKEISTIQILDKEINIEKQKNFELNNEISLLNDKFEVSEIEKKQLLESLESHRQNICDLNKEIMFLKDKFEVSKEDFEIEKKQLVAALDFEKKKGQEMISKLEIKNQKFAALQFETLEPHRNISSMQYNIDKESLENLKQENFDLKKKIILLKNEFEARKEEMQSDFEKEMKVLVATLNCEKETATMTIENLTKALEERGKSGLEFDENKMQLEELSEQLQTSKKQIFELSKRIEEFEKEDELIKFKNQVMQDKEVIDRMSNESKKQLAEINNYKRKTSEIEMKLQEYERQFAEITKRNEFLTAMYDNGELKKLTKELAELKSKYQERSSVAIAESIKSKGLQVTVDKLKSSNATYESQLLELRKKIESIDQLKSEIAKLQSDLKITSSFKKMNEELKSRCEILSSDLIIKEQTISEYQNQKELLDEKLQECLKQLEQSKNDLDSAIKINVKLSSKIIELNSKIKQLELKLMESDTQIIDLNRENASLSDELNCFKLENNKENSTAQMNDLRKSAEDNLQIRFDELALENGALKDELKWLKSNVIKLEKRCDSPRLSIGSRSDNKLKEYQESQRKQRESVQNQQRGIEINDCKNCNILLVENDDLRMKIDMLKKQKAKRQEFHNLSYDQNLSINESKVSCGLPFETNQICQNCDLLKGEINTLKEANAKLKADYDEVDKEADICGETIQELNRDIIATYAKRQLLENTIKKLETENKIQIKSLEDQVKMKEMAFAKLETDFSVCRSKAREIQSNCDIEIDKLKRENEKIKTEKENEDLKNQSDIGLNVEILRSLYFIVKFQQVIILSAQSMTSTCRQCNQFRVNMSQIVEQFDKSDASNKINMDLLNKITKQKSLFIQLEIEAVSINNSLIVKLNKNELLLYIKKIIYILKELSNMKLIPKECKSCNKFQDLINMVKQFFQPKIGQTSFDYFINLVKTSEDVLKPAIEKLLFNMQQDIKVEREELKEISKLRIKYNALKELSRSRLDMNNGFKKFLDKLGYNVYDTDQLIIEKKRDQRKKTEFNVPAFNMHDTKTNPFPSTDGT